MAPIRDRGWALTPFRIAAVYVAVGGVWIVLTDWVLASASGSGALETQLQTVKGWLFVAVSGLLIYGLSARGQEQLRGANERLQRTLRHSSVLHRLLRHDLRNACNVIGLQTETLAERVDDGAVPKQAIDRQVEDLLELGRKSSQLRQITLSGQQVREVALAHVVDEQVAAFTERHPDVRIETDVPEEIRVRAYPELEHAFRELFENAVEHSSTPPEITVSVSQAGDEVTVEVADDGPGFPDMERQVLKEGMERPLLHSQGLGLWIVRVVDESGGDLEVVDNEPSGTIVRLTLPAAQAPMATDAERGAHQTVYPPAVVE